MKFSDYPYERPDIDQYQKSFEDALTTFDAADSFEEQREAIDEIIRLQNQIATARNIARARHSIDTRDEKWEEEHDYFDEISPVLENLNRKYYEMLLESPFQEQLEEHYGSTLFQKARCSVNAFSPEILEERKQENKLQSDYQKLIASARIEFKGEERNLSGLKPFQKSEDRATRKEASEALWGFYDENRTDLDEMFDELVTLRDQMARKLGYRDFVEMGYDRMNRMDYGRDDVKQFRTAVQKHVVPLATELKEKQKERIEVDQLRYYDEPFQFPSGSPEPKGDPEWIVEQAQNMYEELSQETDEFFSFMVENELMDLVNKKGKAGGGYCSFFPDYGAPFIFSNFNGTEGDVRVLTHEGGHAFQMYQSRDHKLPEYQHATADAAEIHSMSMEFFTWPWMEQFFQEDIDKFKFSQLSGAITFLPYAVAVDEFQHRIYENPEMSPEERHETWKELEETYQPHLDYHDNSHLQEGCYWQKQRHIYAYPFYYIDYALAQICALQFWNRAQNDRQEAWKDYVEICRIGGSKPFLGVVETANLESPFQESAVETAVNTARAELETV